MLNQRSPFGIKVLSIVYFACSLFLLVFSILLFFSFEMLKKQSAYFPFLANSNTGFSIGIITIVIALLFFFLGLFLWKKKQLARIASIVFSIIGFIGAIINTVSGRWLSIINLALYALIGLYLIFSKKVKEAFT
jgi:hypothetical protein